MWGEASRQRHRRIFAHLVTDRGPSVDRSQDPTGCWAGCVGEASLLSHQSSRSEERGQGEVLGVRLLRRESEEFHAEPRRAEGFNPELRMGLSLAGRSVTSPLPHAAQSGENFFTCIRRAFVSILFMKDSANSISTGRRGGKARSPAKSMAARQNILLRWHGRSRKGVIPEKALIDGAWYQGRGRTAPIALWIRHQGSSMPSDGRVFPIRQTILQRASG